MQYHVGFRAQAGKWPQHPLDVFITLLRRTPSAVVGDFGCGEARLAASVSNKVHSFDLVALNERIVACDMAHVPLPDAVLDVAVFCLSLMGTNYLDYLREARRVLRKGAPQVRPGRLWVAEVTSRFEGAGVEAFEAAVCAVGFRKAWRRALGPMFVLFEFLVAPQETSSAGKDGSAPPLKPCRYKKR
jgi:ribosomal RNA-processing protein 8